MNRTSTIKVPLLLSPAALGGVCLPFSSLYRSLWTFLFFSFFSLSLSLFLVAASDEALPWSPEVSDVRILCRNSPISSYKLRRKLVKTNLDGAFLAHIYSKQLNASYSFKQCLPPPLMSTSSLKPNIIVTYDDTSIHHALGHPFQFLLVLTHPQSLICSSYDD